MITTNINQDVKIRDIMFLVGDALSNVPEKHNSDMVLIIKSQHIVLDFLVNEINKLDKKVKDLSNVGGVNEVVEKPKLDTKIKIDSKAKVIQRKERVDKLNDLTIPDYIVSLFKSIKKPLTVLEILDGVSKMGLVSRTNYPYGLIRVTLAKNDRFVKVADHKWYIK
jgi:hypothetical protein